MAIEQIVEIPPNRRLFLEVPKEVPAGKAILTYSSVSVGEDDNILPSGELKEKLEKLRGSLGKSAFCFLDGLAYQRKVREEWDD
jgi:hypothetical protein